MRRFNVIFLMIAVILCFTACDSSDEEKVNDEINYAEMTPELRIQLFFDAFSNLDVDKLDECMAFSENDDMEDETEKAYSTAFSDFKISNIDQIAAETILKSYLLDLEYDVENTDLQDNKAIVNVKIHYKDVTPVMRAATKDFYEKFFVDESYYSMEEEELDKRFIRTFNKKGLIVKPGDVECEFTFRCIKDNEDWKIEAFTEEEEILLKKILTSEISYIDYEQLEESVFEELFSEYPEFLNNQIFMDL